MLVLIVSRQTELRQIATSECTVRVRRPEEYVPMSLLRLRMLIVISSPVRFAWLGASRLATNRNELKKVAITRQEYQEHGSSWAGRKFAGAL